MYIYILKQNKMTNNAIIQPILYLDVRQKELLYLKITVGTKEVLINIGKKTFDAVTQLIKPTSELKKEDKK